MNNAVASAAFFSFFIVTLIGFIREDSITTIAVKGLCIYAGILGLGYLAIWLFKKYNINPDDFSPKDNKAVKLDVVVNDQTDYAKKIDQTAQMQRKIASDPQAVAKTLKEMLKNKA